MQRLAALVLPAALLAGGSPGWAGADKPAATGQAGVPAERPSAPRVIWRPFTEAAFRETGGENRLILLYISASWDYHDRIMSDVTYADPGVVDLVMRRFIPVRADTDQRPDLFARYGMGAWPTTAVLLPNGHPMYYPDKDGSAVRGGGTFYTPEVFRAYFDRLATYYADNREMLEKLSASTDDAILAHRNAERAEVTSESVEAVIGKILDAYKARPDVAAKVDRHPDFDMAALSFDYWFRKADRKVLDVGLNYLTDMARGGIYDRIGGGFFRYAHDARFILPAFEKIPPTNAAAIRAYLSAYEVSGNGAFLKFAEGTLDHVSRHGLDPATHAFVGATAAWTHTGDNGDYYTWTEDEMRSALTEEEFKIASAAFDIGPAGEMVDSAPTRNVIFLSAGPQLLGKQFDMDEKRVEAILESARVKLLAAREKRPAPAVDRSTYGDWSGEMASAFLKASATLHKPEHATTALSAIEILMRRCRNANGLIAHVCRPGLDERGDEAFLADQAYTASSLLDAYEQTGVSRFLSDARGLADAAAPVYRDALSGGFSDRPADPNAPGLVSWPVRDFTGNMELAKVLLRLGRLTGEKSYMSAAQRTLTSWADEVGSLGDHGAPYALAAEMLLNPPLEMLVAGDEGDPTLAKGRERVLALYHPWRIVRSFSAADGAAEITKRGLKPIAGAQVAFCVESECAGPYPAGEPLRAHLEMFLNKGKAGDAAAPKAPASKGKDKPRGE